MSETTPPDATPTASLPLADQQPIAPAPAPMPAPAPPAPAAAQRSGHTRTILEVIGGVVAAGLIVIAAGVGFVVGHATGSDDGRFPGMLVQQGARGNAMPMNPFGTDRRGIDPDGDNWTGGGQQNGQPQQPQP